jgi:excinuclease ABC subunit C
MNLPENITEKLRSLPDKPGCYLMRNGSGRIVYVGKATSLRKRVQWYFRKGTQRSADPKLRGLIKSVRDLECIVARNEAEAALTEGRLIKEYRPRYNVSFKDDKRFLMLRGETGSAFPRLKSCRIKRGDGALYFGPYASSAAARAALDFVEKRFGLRKCPPVTPDRATYAHCINDIVRYCSAPCIGKVSHEEYMERFNEACAFLSGERPQHLKELREAMNKTAAEFNFERAAVLRDTLLLLDAAVRQKSRMMSTPEMKRIEAGEGISELQKVLKLEKRPRIIEAYDVSNISGTYSVAGMVCFVDGMPHRNRYRRFRIRAAGGRDDARMLAEAVNRRFSHLKQEGGQAPGLVLVDGGPVQLKFARFELDRLGFREVPVAALAKRLEEVFSPESAVPIRLARDSSALKVLQRLRDEAHRFALTYHRSVRSRRIRESVLDSVPGIGASKKQSLLQHFGSVRRLAKATEEQIAQVPGIGHKLAGVIRSEIGG